jgi:hypothetical protein
VIADPGGFDTYQSCLRARKTYGLLRLLMSLRVITCLVPSRPVEPSVLTQSVSATTQPGSTECPGYEEPFGTSSPASRRLLILVLGGI